MENLAKQLKKVYANVSDDVILEILKESRGWVADGKVVNTLAEINEAK